LYQQINHCLKPTAALGLTGFDIPDPSATDPAFGNPLQPKM
jgi:hypothetical protein